MRSIVARCFFVAILVCVLLVNPAKAFRFHPFYVSVTEMNYNGKTKSFEISCKMFAEDIEDVLKQDYKTAVDLGNAKQQTQNNNLMNDYMTKHLSFIIDGKPAAYKFVGFEKDKESIYCYLEVVNVPSLKKMTVNNSILYDFKKEEINIVHVILNGKRQSNKLDYPQSQLSFSF